MQVQALAVFEGLRQHRFLHVVEQGQGRQGDRFQSWSLQFMVMVSILVLLVL
jgi:hypothetical protein